MTPPPDCQIVYSVVTPVYCSAPFLEEFYSRMKAVLESLNAPYEIIFVNDGSPDQSLQLLEELYNANECIVVVDLSRNFGQHQAIKTGLDVARGEYVFVTDCDLEEHPEWLPDFIAEMKRTGADAVLSAHIGARRSKLYAFLSKIYYRFMEHISQTELLPYTLTSRLLTRRYVEAMKCFPERNYVLSTICQLAGFKQTYLEYEKSYRGESSYTFTKRLDMACRGIVSVSNVPLQWLAFLGAVLTALLVFSIFITGGFYLTGNMRLDNALVIIASMGAFAFISFSISVMCLYMATLMKEVRGRPLTIIRNILSR